MTFHYSTFAPNRIGRQILEWTGGYFDYETGPGPKRWYSRIDTWDPLLEPANRSHPICRGIEPFSITEEIYSRIRFRDGDTRLVPILNTTPPGQTPQTVARAVERADGGRGFGFTGSRGQNAERCGLASRVPDRRTYSMRFEWKPEKNAWLRQHRRISFDQIIVHLGRGDVWKTSPHPNRKKDPHQLIAFVIVANNVYLVPFDVVGDVIFLRTIIPSRKATTLYRKEKRIGT